ncbi:hypothetical protein SAMN05216360_10393 [Methylobacterium phyllostachyos]|uniref:Uncharacterized protein n=1 Tax=Methylobacterium phyllostachyos TaxID=582672 RepID=A0A1G9V787_9HYPH|nr:hypothetical protein [Methylobacterium phyllostachyos]SDM68019.1 hypothetical protein SAMN05216360_10393 [Methylobacterium phyllostachyos]
MTPADLALAAALVCWTPPPAPAVDAPVMAALMGEPMPAKGAAKADVAAALQALAPLRRRPR